MLLENDVIKYEGSDRLLRVLWHHLEKNTVFLIDIHDKQSVPYEVKKDSVINELISKNAFLVDDPYKEVTLETEIKDSHRVIRDKRMAIIAPLIINRPAIFYSDKRGKLISETVELKKCNHRTVYVFLRKYWKQGQKANALLPEYFNSGAKGKTRKFTGVKRGRPRKYSNTEGINVSKDMRLTFGVAVARYYVGEKKFTMKKCFDKMLEEFFCEKKIDPYNGSITISPIKGNDDSHFPTYRQFQYWVDKENNRLDMKKKRLTSRVYDKDMRGLTGTSNSEVWGPGARYQIDATIADVFLLSRIDRRKIIGRPVIYVVIDVYSRMIVGIYIGLEGPSYVAAMMALANAVEDKQAFCRRFGREIEPHEWPCNHLCAILLGDRGEIASNTMNNLINNFNVHIENTGPFRADWKGIVEQRFRLLPALFKAFVDGYIETDYRERGASDYRLDATLDIDQFTAIIIECVLYFNNFHEIKNYDKDHDLAAADFAAVPTDLWEWGIANKSGALRHYPPEKVKFSLMPTAQATITLYGIKLKSQYYTCQKAIQEGWLDKARQNGREKVNVSFDPRDMDVIYLHDKDEKDGYVICNLTPRSRAYAHCTSWEIAQAEHSSKVQTAEHAPIEKMAALNVIANTEAIVEKAKAMKPSSKNVSASSRTKGIHANRAQEKLENRHHEAFRLGDAAKPRPKTIPDNLVAFPSAQDDDYAEPDITEILEAGKKDK